MKYSIQKKLLITSIAITLFSFLLILVSFNYISSKYIERETTKELVLAAENLKEEMIFTLRDDMTVINSEISNIEVDEGIENIDGIIEKEESIENGETLENGELIKNGEFVKNSEPLENEKYIENDEENKNDKLIIDENNIEIEGSFIVESIPLLGTSNVGQNVDYILVNKENQVIYPIEFIITESLKSQFAEKNLNIESGLYNEKEIKAILKKANDVSFVNPKKLSVNSSNYYLMETNFENGNRAIFYKNTQSLDDLVSDVNLVLFFLLLFFSFINVLLNMGVTSGIIKSIRALCGYANEIGNGNLQEKKLDLQEKEFHVLEQDMNKMAQKLSEYDEEQKTFFQNVSHELRTPLMSIQGYAEGISSHLFKDEELDNAANIITNESARLADMVNNLLYVSRMDCKEGQKKKEKIDLIYLLENVIDEIGGIVKDKKITIEKDEPVFNIYGNKDELKTAFGNIITNSLRYAESKVLIQCSNKEKTIIIKDNGPGIKEEDLPHIFKRFYKGEGGCSGIGLAITETIIKNHNATIKAWNNNGAVLLVKFL